MSERKSGAQDTHVGRDCMLLYQQEGDEQHRKAAERIQWLEQEVERLRKAGGHVTGCPLRAKLLAGIAPMCTPCTCDRVYQKRLNRLVGELQQEIDRAIDEDWHNIPNEVVKRILDEVQQ